MIRNVCIHVENEQPLLADLYALPSASDAGLLCTNVRGLDGKRPVFIDHVGSTFFFPYHVVRFLEVPAGAVTGLDLGASGGSAIPAAEPTELADADGGSADDAAGSPASVADPAERLPVAVGASDDEAAHDDAEAELEIDEGFLQRIRDI